MKLYHATTVYQFLNIVALMQKSNSFGEDIIIFAPWMEKKFKSSKPLKQLFKKYHYYDASLFNVHHGKLEEAINKNISSFLSHNHIKLNSFDEIAVGGVQYNFGIYLCNNGIPFSAIEESCGIYSHPEVVYNIDKNIPTVGERADVASNLGIYDFSNEFITKVYCDADSQMEGFQSEKISDLKVLQVLNSLDEEKIALILELFGISSKIKLQNDGVFLLTQQFANLNIMDFKNQILIYQLFSDFFLENKAVFIKPHPDDVCYYSQILKNTTVVREKFPSELTPFVFEDLPKTIATISSTGINSLRCLFEDEISLDFQYEKGFKNTLKYYSGLKLVSGLNLKKCKLVASDVKLAFLINKTYQLGIDLEITNGNEIKEYEPNTAIIIDACLHSDNYIKELLDLNFDLYIFINSDNSLSFYRFELKQEFEELYPIVIEKTKTRSEDNYLDYENEVLYAYSSNKETYKAMKNIVIEKELENTGARFDVQSLTDEQLEIERLKGILAATEKRLLYYINKVKELEEETK